MTHLHMVDQWVCPCQIVRAKAADQQIESDHMLQALRQALRENDYATITITLPLLNREGYQPYPKKPLVGNTTHLEFWRAYLCWLDGNTMVFVPEQREPATSMSDMVSGLLFTQEAYNRLCLRHEGIRAEQWYKITDYGLDIQIEAIGVYIATPLSIFDGDTWHDRQGTYQTDTYFPSYVDAYTYACAIYDSMISTLQNKLLTARKGYTLFRSSHAIQEVVA